MAKSKKDIVKLLMLNGLNETEARRFIASFIEIVGSELLNSRKVKIPRLGTIRMIRKEPRPVRANFLTNEQKMTAVIHRPTIKYAKAFTLVVRGDE